MVRLPTRSALVLALLGALGVAACEKTPATATNSPSEGGATQGGGTVLAYKAAPAKLKQNVQVSVTNSGVFAGSIKFDATGLLAVSDAGGGKLKVDYSMLEVRSVETTGQMTPKPKEGEPAPDLKARLLTGKGARVVDLQGKLDADATKALPENAKQDKDGPGVGALVGTFLGLPQDLPIAAMKEGEEVKLSKQETEDFNGLKLDMDIDLKYTLVKIDASSGKRLAELKIESEGSGAQESGQMQVSLNTSSESTVVLDLDSQLPVRAHVEVTQAGEAQKQTFEVRFVVDATYETAT